MVEAAISQSKADEQEAVMTDTPRDPRLDLTIDDLMTLMGAVTVAVQTLNEGDRLRYQDLAAKLASILLRVSQCDRAPQAGRPA